MFIRCCKFFILFSIWNYRTQVDNKYLNKIYKFRNSNPLCHIAIDRLKIFCNKVTEQERISSYQRNKIDVEFANRRADRNPSTERTRIEVFQLFNFARIINLSRCVKLISSRIAVPISCHWLLCHTHWTNLRFNEYHSRFHETITIDVLTLKANSRKV